jgi:hypothetical protein
VHIAHETAGAARIRHFLRPLDFERAVIYQHTSGNQCRENAKVCFLVIPGRAEREPGIHTPDRGYGFRACAKRRIPE